MKPPKDKDKYYVDPNKFRQEIELYYKTNNCTNYLGQCINKIAEGLGYNSKFYKYSYKEEMIGDAILKMFSALKRRKFDIKSESSPFGYFTTIAFHAFINRIKKEKKQHDTVNSYRERKYEEYLSISEGHVYVRPIIDSTEESYFDQD